MKPTIIAFEGLLGTLGQWVWRGLLRKVPKDFDISWNSWTGAPEIPFGPTIVIGHSFGVRRAIEYASKTNCKLLLLLDPRMPLSGIGGGVAPKGVKTVCIYRKGLMQGYPCLGAENIELKDGTIHTNVPFHPKAWTILSEHLQA